jgi:hypothetical protein
MTTNTATDPFEAEYGSPRNERIEALTIAWEQHCRKVGHTMASEGGDARWDRNLAATYAECSAKGCDWRFYLARVVR